MGTVNFETTIDKIVDLQKQVDLSVFKDAESLVNIDDSLATAEASADALGGAAGGQGGTTRTTFLVDDASDYQATIVLAGTSNEGTAPGEDFPAPPPPRVRDEDLPDGETFNGTDIEGGVRTFTIERFLDGGEAALVATNEGDNPDFAAADRLTFNNDDETTSNQAIIYDADGALFDITEGFEDFEGLDLTNPANNIEFTDVIADPGLAGQTVRIEVEFEDADNDVATGRVAVTEDFEPGIAVQVPLGNFTGDIPAPPIGTEIEPGLIQLVDTTDAIDFDELVRIELRILDNLDQDTTLPVQEDFETAGAGATDLSLDDILFNLEFDGGEGAGVLSETDTFAQVSEDGAFSFSEALAASSPVEEANAGNFIA